MQKIFCSTVLLALVTANGLAQETRTENQQPAETRRSQAIRQGEVIPPQASPMNVDQQLAAVIATGCRNEVEVAKFAQSRIRSKEIKAFTEKLIRDHQEACVKLEKLAGDHHREAAVGRNESNFDWVAVHQQIADQCLKSTKEMLSEHEGKNFDRCFIGQQIAAHMKMVDELKVYQKFASPNLRRQIDSSLASSESHLKEAKQIVETKAKEQERSSGK